MAFLQDITLGKYMPADSFVHRLDPRTKFLSTLGLMIAVLATPGFVPLLGYSAFLGLAISCSGLPYSLILKNLRPFVWLFSFTFFLHALMTPGLALWIVPYLGWVITIQGLEQGGFFSLRLAVVIVTASLMTLTTSPMPAPHS